jgi:hypothetical protein
VVGVIVGPVLAMFLAHVFSGGLARHVKEERVANGCRSSEQRCHFSSCACPQSPSSRSCSPWVSR